MNDLPRRAGALGGALLFIACGGAPAVAPERAESRQERPHLPRRADAPDDCAPVPGQPEPAPLRTQYSGLAKAARCDREVYTIMGGVTHFLGVDCKHCHVEPDYAADTHNKRVANWMATELLPRLAKRSGDEVSCKDCHAGKAKILGNPRRAELAIDWMLTHMVDDFQTRRGLPPKCKDCHGGDLGSSQFRPKLKLTELGGLPPPPSSTLGAVAPAPGPVAPDNSAASEALAPSPDVPAPLPPVEPIPDFGGR